VADLKLFSDDAAVAETAHGDTRRECMERLGIDDSNRWPYNWLSRCKLADAVWESAWDEAVLAVRLRHHHEERVHHASVARLIVQRDAEIETARAWRERYEDQLRITQDLDRRWTAKQRDSEQEIARLRSAVGDAYGDLGAALVQTVTDDDPVIMGHVRAAADTLRAAWRGRVGMPVREALAQERALSALVGQVQYVETSLVEAPPDPLCALRPASEAGDRDKDGTT
jgi:hypothetical protein